jgi:hypothetical protein
MRPLHYIYIAIILLIFTSGCEKVSKTNQDQISIQINNSLSEQLLTPLPTPTQVDLMPYKAIKLVWLYGIPIDNVDPKLFVENIDLFISTKGLEQQRDQLRTQGTNAPFFQYILFNEIEDPGNCNGEPFFDQVADKPGDYCRIDRLNPDWFLTTNDGNRIHSEPPYDNYWMLDPGNPGWREFWLSRMQERENLGWNGIFLDNLEARPQNHENVLDQKRYPDVASYQQANLEFLQFLYEYYHAKNTPVFANILAAENIRDWTLFLPYLDGAMLEDFAVDWDSGYYSPEKWEEQMEIARTTQLMGKKIILVSQGNRYDIERQKFSLGSFLLVQQGNAFFRYTHAGNYDQPWMYLNYLLDPGRPKGDKYKQGESWKRDFEHGYVSVNPISHKVEISVTQ